MTTQGKGTLPGVTKRPPSDAEAAGRLPTQRGTTPSSQTDAPLAPAPDELHSRNTIEWSPAIGTLGDPPPTLNVPTPGGMEARIAAVTTAGGFTKLPDNFGDRGGDWVSVRAKNAFEILYLDWRQAERITPEMTSRHQALLTAFWTRNIRAMTEGARVAVVDKYGGEHRSPELIQSYPAAIAEAFSRLATREAIDATSRELFVERQESILARLDEQLTVCLFDKALQPAETRALFEFADREGIARDLVAAHVANRLAAEQIKPVGPVSGATGAERLLSTTWAHDSVRPNAPDPQKPRNRFVPVFLFSIAVVLVLVVSSALWSRRAADTTVGSVVQPPTNTRALSTGSLPPTEPQVPATSTPNRPVDKPLPSVAKDLVPAPPAIVAPVVSAEQRRAVHNRIEAIRRLADSDPKAAVEQVGELDSSLAEHESEYAGERLDIANIRAQIQSVLMEQRLTEERARAQQETDARAQQERDKQWEQRLAQIESLSKQGNYSGAKSLADQLLGEPSLPQPIATRAKKLSDDAVAQLQKIFSDTKVNSKTTRAPHG
jgi:hypothetical protein